MFWGLQLKANRKYTQTIKKGFHLSQAALDIATCSDEPVQVVLTSDSHNYILCTLRKNKTEQVALDLNFAEGDEISFTSQGNGNVHLSGYLIPEPEDGMNFLEEEESETEELEIQKPKKIKGETGKAKKAQQEDDEDDDDEDDSDFDEEGEGEEEDDGEEDEDEDEEDSSDEEITEPKPKQIKLDKSKQNGLENGQVQPKEKHKKDKKEKKQQQQPEKSPKGGEKVMQGGVRVEDIRVGNGPEAKPGKKVQVYYEGRLKSNNKMFDSSKQGSGFKFGLGRGEVIKGWDIGVAGMKVGGKRRITCPPNMAYGAKGSPPVIPPNSTLIFEVELKAVN